MACRYGERLQSLLLTPSIKDCVRAYEAFVDALDLDGSGNIRLSSLTVTNPLRLGSKFCQSALKVGFMLAREMAVLYLTPEPKDAKQPC